MSACLQVCVCVCARACCSWPYTSDVLCTGSQISRVQCVHELSTIECSVEDRLFGGMCTPSLILEEAFCSSVLVLQSFILLWEARFLCYTWKTERVNSRV